MKIKFKIKYSRRLSVFTPLSLVVSDVTESFNAITIENTEESNHG